MQGRARLEVVDRGLPIGPEPAIDTVPPRGQRVQVLAGRPQGVLTVSQVKMHRSTAHATSLTRGGARGWRHPEQTQEGALEGAQGGKAEGDGQKGRDGQQGHAMHVRGATAEPHIGSGLRQEREEHNRKSGPPRELQGGQRSRSQGHQQAVRPAARGGGRAQPVPDERGKKGQKRPQNKQRSQARDRGRARGAHKSARRAIRARRVSSARASDARKASSARRARVARKSARKAIRARRASSARRIARKAISARKASCEWRSQTHRARSETGSHRKDLRSGVVHSTPAAQHRYRS